MTAELNAEAVGGWELHDCYVVAPGSRFVAVFKRSVGNAAAK